MRNDRGIESYAIAFPIMYEKVTADFEVFESFRYVDYEIRPETAFRTRTAFPECLFHIFMKE